MRPIKIHDRYQHLVEVERQRLVNGEIGHLEFHELVEFVIQLQKGDEEGGKYE